jgi:hypothetical protein
MWSSTYAAASDVQKEQVRLIRDIFGNPFRFTSIAPFPLSNKVVSLAQSAYDQSSFHLLPVIADALEETECHNAEVVSHCRQPGPHVRGCWAVDWILARQRSFIL